MQTTMPKLFVALLVTLILCTTIDRALADTTTPSSAVVQEIYQRYSPRLQSLTPTKVENIWRGQAKREPWYQRTYNILDRGKDDPELVNMFRREFPCEETSTAARDRTYAVVARQYRCAATLSVDGVSANVAFYLNVNDIGTLESVAFYQSMHGATIKQLIDAGLSQHDAMVLAELHSEVKSRIDSARAPPGVYVEYSRTGDAQKFAVRFK